MIIFKLLQCFFTEFCGVTRSQLGQATFAILDQLQSLTKETTCAMNVNEKENTANDRNLKQK